MFLHNVDEKLARLYNDRDSNICEVLLSKGLLKEQHVSAFRKVGTNTGLREWCMQDEGCRVVTLSK